MMPVIVGFEIKADQLENVFKLSQNRDKESYENIISKLQEKGGSSALVANELIKRRAELFPDSTK
jgi:transcriptional regulator